jgi:hypothetical protein
MQNLRIINVQVVDSSNISVTFSAKLNRDLVSANVSIIAETTNIPSSAVLGVSVSQNVLSLTCQPLTPLATYFLQFQSVPLHPFVSINGEDVLPEDGVSNRFLINGPLEPENPVKNFLTSFLNGNIYDIADDTTVVSKYLNALSINLSRALHDIRQVKNENYLSVTINDERQIRGAGPFDRLNEEGAYEILRVGRTPTGASVTTSFAFDAFPFYPVTLRKQVVQETLTASSVDVIGQFNINSLVFNLGHSPVTRVTSIVFTLSTANPIYVYSIPTLGYQIQNARYDQDFGFSYLQLNKNQVRISDQILSDPNFSLTNILKVDIQYEYQNQGIVVDSSTVSVHTTLTASREVLPPIVNVFSLQHAPVVNADGTIAGTGGITFTDPNNATTGAKHPAFQTEIPFRFSALPSSPGQYAIDYQMGQVYVFGSDSSNDGTGPSPPLATYLYKFTYKPEQDYVFDPDTLDLVSLPLGNLIGTTGTITFKYEQALIPDVDYKANLHREVLTERIENRLLATNAIRTKNSPITNVFRIRNETSGEIYTLTRWNDDKVYFRFNTPPRVNIQSGERASFQTVPNELLFVNSILTSTSSLRVFKILLNNNNLISSTEDGIGSAFNSSVVFSNASIFVAERWFNTSINEMGNVNRLQSVGDYLVNYASGIAYVAVSNVQGLSIGTVTYKVKNIVPQFPHLLSVDDLYYRVSSLTSKNKSFTPSSFGEGSIVPQSLDLSVELLLNGGAPYQTFNGSVGAFVDASFVAGVSNQVKFVRALYEYNDLLNSTHPINFAPFTTTSGINVTVAPFTKQVFGSVQFDGTKYYVLINENIPYLSPSINYVFSVVRNFDSAQLWDGYGAVVPGNPFRLNLSGANSPAVGNLVTITYTFTIQNLARVALDYNRGDFFVDYTYVADEIIISYEYGDNVLDFRSSQSIPANTEYFVSYKVGALRDALLKNFGTLVNIPELSNFDVDFDRERYREALMAALSSFIQGPTVPAIKNIGKKISHIEPDVIESGFAGWSLGSSLLNPESITTTGAFQLLPAKFGNGVLVDQPSQSISFPVAANLRLEEGTFETWLSPQWNGLDNDATITFNITQDGYAINPSEVFIGASEYHPVITNGVFSLTKNSNVVGKPNTKKDGVFIYLDKDISGDFQRWYVDVIDGYVDGYADGYGAQFQVQVSTNGKFYDVKSITSPKPSNMTVTTGSNTLKFAVTGGTLFEGGLTFLADLEHYLLDFGEDKSKNRLSIYKDVSGYFVFRVFDKDRTSYMVSTDVSGWLKGSLHHVAASWKLGTQNSRDELHLFIDGLEVPNIIRYGQNLQPFLHEKFRTVNPEEVLGLASRDIVASTDLRTTAGSALVTSSLNFSSFQIFAGDTIFIDESGFSTSGYTITNVNGQTLTLNTTMPLTLSNARFSINRTQFKVISDIDVAPNIAVSVIHALVSGSDLSGISASTTVSSASINFTNAGVVPGHLINIGKISSPITFVVLQVSGTSLTLDSPLPSGFSGSNFSIYSNTESEIPGVRAVRPSYSISKSTDGYFNNILTVSNNVLAKDLLLIRTLGFNHRSFKKRYYLWSNLQENILMTRMPPPISLDEAKITHVILPNVAIGPNNSTLVSGTFQSNNLSTSQPVPSQIGRTLTVTLGGSNVDFSTPVLVKINGIVNSGNITETLSFSDYGSLDTANHFTSINYVNVQVKPLNSTKNAVNVEIREKFSVTFPEISPLYPIIRYSYQIGAGYSLHDAGSNIVRDENNTFSGLDIGNYLFIQSPASVAGYYKITGLASTDRKSISIQPTNAAAPLPLPSFNGGLYRVLNVSQFRSGLQNGFFTFETANSPGQGYVLPSGFYDVEYSTYARIKLDPIRSRAFLGSDFTSSNQLHGIIDQVKVYSTALTDTRIGENIPSSQRSITKDFNSLKPLKSDSNTLMLLSMDSFPIIDGSSFYSDTPTSKNVFRSSVVINDNFGKSGVISDQPIAVPNTGILDTRKEGTIEFWVNPLFDTGNDPNDRFYFDAFGAVLEETISVDNVSVKISAPASKILSVKLKGDPDIDYFVGGELEIDTQRAVRESTVSASSNSVVTATPILQVITVKIEGDLTETDYFTGGSIGTDRKTIYLGKTLPDSHLPLIVTYQSTVNNNDRLNTQIIRLNRRLPQQKTPVVVNYLPAGLQGDRIAIFKDKFGYVNFSIIASGTEFLLRGPTRWAKHTWHRVKASYRMNSSAGTDAMKLFLDGYEYTNVLIGSAAIFGGFPFVTGASMAGDGYNVTANIQFKDPINDLMIGSDYTKANTIFSLIDNLRISNIFRPVYAPYGEALDVNYSSNLNVVFPVTSDLYTTYLLDFDSSRAINTDFSTLRNKKTGNFDFEVHVKDGFGLISGNPKSKVALEKLVKILKPANSRVFIGYI